MKKTVLDYQLNRKKIRQKLKTKINFFLKKNKSNLFGIYGAGIHTLYLKEIMNKDFQKVSFFLDGNKSKHNKMFLKKRIFSLSDLKKKIRDNNF